VAVRLFEQLDKVQHRAVGNLACQAEAYTQDMRLQLPLPVLQEVFPHFSSEGPAIVFLYEAQKTPPKPQHSEGPASTNSKPLF